MFGIKDSYKIQVHLTDKKNNILCSYLIRANSHISCWNVALKMLIIVHTQSGSAEFSYQLIKLCNACEQQFL